MNSNATVTARMYSAKDQMRFRRGMKYGLTGSFLYWVVVALVFLSSGCAGPRVDSTPVPLPQPVRPPLHQGALSELDSRAFDVMTIAQAVIENVRVEINDGHIPASYKPALNGLIDAYNETRQTWLDYRSVMTELATAKNEGTEGRVLFYSNLLEKNMTVLINLISLITDGREK